MVTLDDDPVPDPQPANSDPSPRAADSHAAMFRTMRRDAACNWPRVPNDSVQTLTADAKRSCPVAGMSRQRYQRVEPRLARMWRIKVHAGVTPTTASIASGSGSPGGSGQHARQEGGVDVPRLRALQRNRRGSLPAGPACESRHAARTSATLASIATDQDFCSRRAA